MKTITLPTTGDTIRGRRELASGQQEEYVGVVDYIFPAEVTPDDEPCIVLSDGTFVFPTLGDTWEAAPEGRYDMGCAIERAIGDTEG